MELSLGTSGRPPVIYVPVELNLMFTDTKIMEIYNAYLFEKRLLAATDCLRKFISLFMVGIFKANICYYNYT